MQLLLKAMSHFMCKNYSIKIYLLKNKNRFKKKIEKKNILKNIIYSTVIMNTRDYPLFLFENILQISVKKKKLSKFFSKLLSEIFI